MMRRAIAYMQNRKLALGFCKWVEFATERREQERKLRAAMVRFVKRQMSMAYNKWRQVYADQKFAQRVILEKTIVKIGSLLALGFGEAGAEIIGQNMKGSETAALNAMIPGKKVDAIFGFCDIRNFADATEVLQDQVMLFVNRIA